MWNRAHHKCNCHSPSWEFSQYFSDSLDWHIINGIHFVIIIYTYFVVLSFSASSGTWHLKNNKLNKLCIYRQSDWSFAAFTNRYQKQKNKHFKISTLDSLVFFFVVNALLYAGQNNVILSHMIHYILFEIQWTSFLVSYNNMLDSFIVWNSFFLNFGQLPNDD